MEPKGSEPAKSRVPICRAVIKSSKLAGKETHRKFVWFYFSSIFLGNFLG